MSDLSMAIAQAITETMTEKSVTVPRLSVESGIGRKRLRRLLTGAQYRSFTADDMEAIGTALGTTTIDLYHRSQEIRRGMPPFRQGHRVQFVGMPIENYGPLGTVTMTVKDGVLVRWDHDHTVRELVHPNDLRLFIGSAVSA